MVRLSDGAPSTSNKAQPSAVMLVVMLVSIVSVQGASLSPSNKSVRELVSAAQTTNSASGDSDSTSTGTSATSTSVSEVFQACDAEAACAACLEITPDLDCRRDTIVNAYHCDEVEEVLCCAFRNDPNCTENETLLKAIDDLNESVCPLELSCVDGGIDMLNLEGVDADLLVATGPDAIIAPDAGGATARGASDNAEADSGDGSEAVSENGSEGEPESASSAETEERSSGAATGTGETIVMVAAASVIAAASAALATLYVL